MKVHGQTVIEKPNLISKYNKALDHNTRCGLKKTDGSKKRLIFVRTNSELSFKNVEERPLPSKPQKDEPKVIRNIEAETLISTIGKRLLADIHEIFKTRKVSNIKTKRLLAHLCSNQEKPWATFCSGQNLNSRKLSSLLKGFGIHSRDIRFKQGVYKGYRKKWFMKAYRRLKT
jgi:hypothetical protein